MSFAPRPAHGSAVILGIGYFALAAAAISLTRFHGGVAFISIANAALLARLLTLRPTHWRPYLVACAIAGAAVTWLVGLGAAAAAPMAALNTGEAVLAAWLLHHVGRDRDQLGSQASLTWFLAAAGVIAPAASAFGAAGVATALGGDTYAGNWLAWFTGHSLGIITFTPVATYMMRGDPRRWLDTSRPAQLVEGAAHLLLITAISAYVFAQDSKPLLFLPMLPIILAVFRSNRLTAAISVVILALIGGGITISGHGPISLLGGSTAMHIQFLQFYLACTVLTVLPVSAELARRESLYRRLHDSEARYRLLAENSTDIMLNLDVAGRIRFASPAIRQIGGYAPEDVIGRDATELVDPADVARVTTAHRQALADPTRTFIVEYRATTMRGETRWFETHTRAVLDDQGGVTGTVSVVRDVNHRKTVEDRLEHAAMTDPLTNIANRRAFDSRLDTVIERTDSDGAGCVAIFDLDHFKLVNDRFGHAAGDLVLQRFAEIARERMREKDLVARIGGEEFAVILPGATMDQALLVCDRLRAAVASATVVVATGSIGMTVSGGVAAYDAASIAEHVMAQADAALYRAKLAGRDRLALAA